MTVYYSDQILTGTETLNADDVILAGLIAGPALEQDGETTVDLVPGPALEQDGETSGAPAESIVEVPTRPIPRTEGADRLHARIEPWKITPASERAWDVWCRANGDMLDDTLAIVADSPTGVPGWARLFDELDTQPRRVLNWIGMFAGVDGKGLTDEEFREEITVPSGLRRGTVPALKNAIRRTLTGERRIVFRERFNPNTDGDAPYHLTVVTRTDETPAPAATRAAALTQKPAGLILHMVQSQGVTWEELEGTTWDELTGTTWQDLLEGNAP